ncbi:MAG: DUF1284 domain-containing protein [Thermoplasmata archaeon]|nr:DUF1284 domain-containing protein [Thermoplasmata archaeon]
MVLHLRPHHLLCLPRFRGEGYSPRFVERAAELAKALERERTRVILEEGADDLCGACPLLGERCGSAGHQLAEKLDKRVLEATGLRVSEEILAKEALDRVAEVLPTVRGVCIGCQWLELCLKIEGEGVGGKG